MRIETDKYLITTEGQNFVVQIKEEVKDNHLLKDKSKVGEVKLSSKTFYPNLELAYGGLVRRMALSDDCIENFNDIKLMIRELTDEVKCMRFAPEK